MTHKADCCGLYRLPLQRIIPLAQAVFSGRTRQYSSKQYNTLSRFSRRRDLASRRRLSVGLDYYPFQVWSDVHSMCCTNAKQRVAFLS